MEKHIEPGPEYPGVGRVAGRTLTKEHFRVVEEYSDVSTESLCSVVRGELAAYVVRGFVDADECERISKRFWQSTAIPLPHGNGNNGLEAFILGSSHYGKTTAEYLDDVERTDKYVADVYDQLPSPMSRLMSVISEIDGVQCVRPAEHQGRRSALSKLVSWNQTGQFNLRPHDDLAQLRDPLQKGFEIQQVDKVIAVNIYPSARMGEGQIRVWNVCPSVESRRSFGVEFSGFPYPVEALEGIDFLTIDSTTGDLCVLYGNLIHAVLGGANTLPRRRLLATGFGGLTGNQEFLVWT